MRALRTVLNKHKHSLLARENVVGVGLGYKSVRSRETPRKSIVVLVEKKKPEHELLRGHVVPRKIDDVETDVIETGEIRFLGRTDRMRPAPPGVSIGNYRITAGTFGAVVKENNGNRIFIVSNNHVLANATNGQDGRSAIGDAILQPGAYDGGTKSNDTIGSLYNFVPVYLSVQSSQCPVAAAVETGTSRVLKLVTGDYRMRFEKETNQENIVDAALAEPVQEDYITDEILEIGKVQGVAEVEVGMRVKKSGRTSGLTEGVVQLTDVVIKVNMDAGNEALFADQVMTDMVSRPGDSGSLVLDEDNRAVGLLFAGSDSATLFNRIPNVLSMLDVGFVT